MSEHAPRTRSDPFRLCTLCKPARRVAVPALLDHMRVVHGLTDGPPTIDTVEGKRFLLAVRCAQARLMVELLRHDTTDQDELDALDAVAGACALLADVAERHDWSNEDGE
jgi:hypothetical protein